MSASHREMVQPGVVLGQWWHRLDDGRIQCDLCPRECKLHEGQRGFCFVRQAQNGGVVLTTYGRASGFCIDPIEKKPLNHFYPGTSVLSFGTAGCNLGCRFCQNWDISKARAIDRVSDWASPEQVAEAAARIDCRSIAFTYNDPVIFAEYAIDCAQAAHERRLTKNAAFQRAIVMVRQILRGSCLSTCPFNLHPSRRHSPALPRAALHPPKPC